MRVVLIILIFFYLPVAASGEDGVKNKFCEPNLEEGIHFITDMLISDSYLKLREKSSDINLVDSIYARSLKFYNSDISETLLALTFSTLPFKSMPLKLPLINIKLEIPLPAPPDSIFEKRLFNLPRRILFDSPHGGMGDVDKLAHFFGNAFISYNISFFNFSKFMGIFVEMFEAAFKVGGGMDHKDVVLNHLGELFAQTLRHNRNVLPSQIFSIYPVFYSIYSL